MKKSTKIFILPLVLALLVTLTGCAKKQKSSNVYDQVKESKTITWGVKADTRLFGLMSIKTGKIEGFEVDLAKALTKQMLGKDAKAEFVQTTPKTRIPLLKNGNIDGALKKFKQVVAKSGIPSECKKREHYSKPGVQRREAKKAGIKNSRKKQSRDRD